MSNVFSHFVLKLKFFMYTPTFWSDHYKKLQVSNYIFQLLHSNIDEDIESSLLINNI